MKYKFLLLSFILSSFLLAQNKIDPIDKMIDEMCISFRNSENLSDSLRIQSLNEKFIFPYLDQFSESERDSTVDHLYFRFQKRCQYFREYLQKVDPPKNDNWQTLKMKPKITIKNKKLSKFKKQHDFYYFEYGGEKTFVKTDDYFWTETFADGTYSKLTYQWVGNNKFDLIFIESNNNSRKNFSKKGDRYRYEIISKENNFYTISVEVSEQSDVLLFKLFENDKP